MVGSEVPFMIITTIDIKMTFRLLQATSLLDSKVNKFAFFISCLKCKEAKLKQHPFQTGMSTNS